MADEAKKGLLAILAPGAGEGGGEEENLGEEAKRQAARDLASAVKGGDEEAIVSAFRRLYDACAAERETEGDDYGDE